MKYILTFFIFTLSATVMFAQQLNQFDSNGKRHGKWKKNFEGTEVLRYEGQFEHGKEVGVFKFYQNLENKAVLAATRTFKKDTDIAQVVFYTSTGNKVSEGAMRGKTYVGKWLYYHKNSDQLMTSEFYNNKGKLEGLRTTYYLNGNVAEKANYKNGKLDGLSQWFSGEGVLIREYTYKDNMLHGAYKSYDEKGSLILEGQYQNDYRHGIWKTYKDGKLIEENDFTRRSKNPYKNNKKTP